MPVKIILLIVVLGFTGVAIKSQEDICNNTMIYLSEDDHRYQLLNVDTLMAEDLPNNSLIDSYPVYSPDRTRLAFYSWLDRGFAINVMNADGTNLRQVATGLGMGTTLLWSLDGNQIAFESKYQTFLVNLIEGNITQITTGELISSPLNWIDDGTAIIVGQSDPQISMSLALVDVSTGVATPITPTEEWVFDYFVTQTPEGDILFNSNRLTENLSLHRLNMKTGKISVYTDKFVTGLSWTSDFSSFVFMSSQSIDHPNISLQNIYITDWPSGVTRQITEDWTVYHENFFKPALSPDNRRIVFETFVEDNYELFIINIDGSELRQLTFNDYHDTSPQWLPCIDTENI